MEHFTTLFAADEVSWLAFRWRLAEAVAWAKHYPIPAAHLPSTYPLQSPYQRIIGASAISQTYLTYLHSRQEQEALVRAITHKRGEILRESSCYPQHPANDLATGALLLYYPDDNLYDGVASIASQRFFTVDNVLPCETWLGFILSAEGRIHRGNNEWTHTSSSRALISYIPDLLISYAADGVAVNPEMCLLWAHDLDAPFTRLLFSAGLLQPSWS